LCREERSLPVDMYLWTINESGNVFIRIKGAYAHKGARYGMSRRV